MRIMQVPLIAALGMGGIALLSTPAEAAAAKPCVSGQWIMTSQTGVVTGKTSDGTSIKITWAGAAGTRLTLSSTAAAFNFDKSKLEYHTEKFGGKTAKQRTTYRKTLKAKSKFTGSGKGKFDIGERSAQGPATAQMTYTSPKHKVFRPTSLANLVRQGYFDSPVITGGTFTCSTRRLVLTHEEKTDTDTMSHQLTFRRA